MQMILPTVELAFFKRMNAYFEEGRTGSPRYVVHLADRWRLTLYRTRRLADTFCSRYDLPAPLISIIGSVDTAPRVRLRWIAGDFATIATLPAYNPGFSLRSECEEWKPRYEFSTFSSDDDDLDTRIIPPQHDEVLKSISRRLRECD